MAPGDQRRRRALLQPPLRLLPRGVGGLEAVRRDIEQAQKIGVTSTPTYVVNGLPIAGALPPAMFDELLRVLRDNGS